MVNSYRCGETRALPDERSPLRESCLLPNKVEADDLLAASERQCAKRASRREIWPGAKLSCGPRIHPR